MKPRPASVAPPFKVRIAIRVWKRLDWWARRLRTYVENWGARHDSNLLIVSRAGRVEKMFDGR